MRTAVHVTWRIVSAVIMLAVLGLVALLVVLPRVASAQPLTVLSSSMEPTFKAGSTVVIRPVDPGDLSVGDVITFQAAPGVKELITHRILEVQPTTPISFITKGDNNGGPDLEPVPAGAVRGQVWFDVPYVGYVAEFAQRPTLLALLLMGGGLVVGLQLLASVRAGGASRRPSTDAQADAASVTLGDRP